VSSDPFHRVSIASSSANRFRPGTFISPYAISLPSQSLLRQRIGSGLIPRSLRAWPPPSQSLLRQRIGSGHRAGLQRARRRFVSIASSSANRFRRIRMRRQPAAVQRVSIASSSANRFRPEESQIGHVVERLVSIASSSANRFRPSQLGDCGLEMD